MLRVYAAGGTAINIAKKSKDLDVDFCFLDTSDSNLKNVNRENCFILEEVGGAGKDRSIAHQHFKDLAGDVLIRHKPSNDLNIVSFSISGGSGASMGPLMVKELIANNYNTIAVAVDSRNSIIEIDNSIRTLKTLKGYTNVTKKSISMFFVENTNRQDEDERVLNFISLMSLLVNKQNTDEFDMRDLKHFINFDAVTDNEPTVSIIDINENSDVELPANTAIVSTIFVTTNPFNEIRYNIPEYRATCVITDKNYKNEDLRIDNILGAMAIIFNKLEDEARTHKEVKKVNKFKEIAIQDNGDDGFFK